MAEHIDHMIEQTDRGDLDGMRQAAVDLTDTLVDEINRAEVEALGRDVAERIGATVLAVRTFAGLESVKREEVIEVFLVVCLWCIGNALRQ